MAETKTCLTCLKELPIDDFYARQARCKACVKKAAKERRDLLKQRTPEEAITKTEKRCNECKKVLPVSEFYIALVLSDGLSSTCIKCTAKRQMFYLKRSPKLIEEAYQTKKAWREKNIEKHRESNRKSAKRNRAHKNIYQQERRENEPRIRLRDRLSQSIRRTLQGGKQSETTMELVGCDPDFLVTHIENQFDENMSWDNFTHWGWHIDHIRPCATFKLSMRNRQRFVCYNWRNLQPMLAIENLTKQDQYTPEDEAAWEEMMRDLGYEGELYLIY